MIKVKFWQQPAPRTPISDSAPRRLNRFERSGIAALLVLVVLFGAVTLHRSAFLDHRHTDADVYFRAAWAIRAGENLYKVSDTNGWHYHYPPLLAILLAPLADPPESVTLDADLRLLPYPVSVAIWYAAGVIIFWWALHLLAGAIEAASINTSLQKPVPFERRWWALRLTPALVCMAAIGYTLGRGQVNFLLLLSICGMCASMLRGRSFGAGAWLALGSCIKLYLAVLLLYPLLCRNRRLLFGFAAGMFAGLVLIPSITIGPERTALVYRDLYELRLKGILTGAPHPDISGELDVLGGQFPTYGAALFKALNRDPGKWPDSIPPLYLAVQLAVGVAMIGFTLLIIGRVPSSLPLADVLGPGAILLAIIPAITTCKPHYYALAAVPVMGLIASVWERRGKAAIGWGWWAIFAAFFILNFMSEVTWIGFLHAGILTPLSSIMLWLASVFQLYGLKRDLR